MIRTLLLALCLLAYGQVHAQEYPSRPVRVIVPPAAAPMCSRAYSRSVCRKRRANR